MNAPRVYHRNALQVGRDALLEGPAAHHLARVLRIRPGEPVVVFDGNGGEYHASVRVVERNGVRVRCERFDPVERESPLSVGLAQVVSAGERMEFTVQKAVELGAAWVQPLAAHRSKVRLTEERAERRIAHWQRIAEAACEQCGRNQVPVVRELLEFREWLGLGAAGTIRILLDPNAAQRLSEAGPLDADAVLLSGAESGFTAEELELAIARGFKAVRLGRRVLRTETAGLAALAAMQALWGDF